MTNDEIRGFIVDEVAASHDRAVVTDDYPLLETGILDSLGIFNLVGYLENVFGVEIQDEELVPANFGTIADIARLIETKRAASRS